MDFHWGLYNKKKKKKNNNNNLRIGLHTSVKPLSWPLGILVQVQKPPHPQKPHNQLQKLKPNLVFYFSNYEKSFFLGRDQLNSNWDIGELSRKTCNDEPPLNFKVKQFLVKGHELYLTQPTTKRRETKIAMCATMVIKCTWYIYIYISPYLRIIFFIHICKDRLEEWGNNPKDKWNYLRCYHLWHVQQHDKNTNTTIKMLIQVFQALEHTSKPYL